MQTAAAVSGCGFGPRVQTGGAMLLVLLCASLWAPCAHSATEPSGTPRTEFFVTAGAALGTPVGLRERYGWTTIQAGGAYCVTRSVAVGVATGWHFIGTMDQIYFPPGGDFTSAKETISMMPAIGYVKVRLPMNSRGGVPYIAAGAGSYTLRVRTKGVDGLNYSDTRFGFNAAIGFAGKAGAYSPHIEFRFDARSMGQRESGVIWPHTQLQVFTVSLGLQLP